MINEKRFNHSRKKLLEIYYSERAIANLDLIFDNKIKKFFRGKKQQEKYLHEKGMIAVCREIGIRHD